MWALLLVAIVVALCLLKTRETFVFKYGNPFDDEDLISFDPEAKGTRVFGVWPDTCPADRPEYDAGLCYVECKEGYHGVADRCWADTVNIGIGYFARPKGCKEMGLSNDYREDPLTCWKDLKCRCKPGGKDLFGNCYAWNLRCEGPDLKARTLTCPGPEWADWGRGDSAENTDFVDGLCYKKCPADKPHHVSGMPYLCATSSELSYSRGGGTVPPILAFGP